MSRHARTLRQAPLRRLAWMGIVATAVALLAAVTASAQEATRVTTYKDAKGWKVLVNGEDFYIKGMVWGYTPRDENYTYNLWGESDDHIRKVLDYDFGLMKAAGVNAVRQFTTIPPKWVTYIYETYGIMTVINPLMGRYGATVGGKWIPNTDYSDELTRMTLKMEFMEAVNRFKDVPGVLMFALGNENNYGLSWKSFEIENLPEGEQQAAKAKFLYTLYNETIQSAKKINANHPYAIVNGDIQYIDLIAEHCPDLDILGSNVYRGQSFTSLWEEVDAKLDLPVLYFEFGSDAFNAREFREDQQSQARILKAQWQEMYNKAYGNGEEGNSIGGFVFEWRDEWWKYLQTENLDVHDTNASWSNAGYPFDWVEGQNNMNEEWFGITALGLPNEDGVHTARPRMAYDVLQQIWKIDPYETRKAAINRDVESLDMGYYELAGEVRRQTAINEEANKTLRFTGGRLKLEYVLKGTESDIDERGENGVEFSDGQMVFLDFAFAPSSKLDGQLSLNILANVADTEPLEIQYGRRGFPVNVITEELRPDGTSTFGVETFADRDRVEIYDFSASYRGEHFDLNAFYHVPRYHLKYKGDFFGLIREATDLEGMDIWNSKAPEGVELIGKGALDGLTILFGPEIYWGANPKVVLKYSSQLGGIEYTFMHSEDVARLSEGISSTGATERQSRQTTLYTKTNLTDDVSLELGGLISATEKVDDLYDRLDGNQILLDEVEFEDTLAVRTKLSFPLFGSLAYLSSYHAGLVADGGDVLREFGTRLPYSGLGNKEEYELGVMMTFGNLMVFPRLLYRDNYLDANPFIDSSIVGGVLNTGIAPRDRETDPFAVLDNRKARAAELFITWDPTGATPFYQWDNDWREDAGFAFNIGLNYTEYPTPTDAYLFFFQEGGFNASFGSGLPAEDVWEASSRMVFNPSRRVRFISNLRAGSLQSTGNPEGGTRKFYEWSPKLVIDHKHILEGYVKKDAWGPYDFHRQFNVTYPWQYKLDYSLLLDQRRNELRSTKIGVRSLLRRLDGDSPADELGDADNDYLFQTVFYFIHAF